MSDATGLPVYAARPTAIDRLLGFENRLNARQMMLLAKFRRLSAAQQQWLIDEARPGDFIPADAIEGL